jgi:hypothetical protein
MNTIKYIEVHKLMKKAFGKFVFLCRSSHRCTSALSTKWVALIHGLKWISSVITAQTAVSPFCKAY